MPWLFDVFSTLEFDSCLDLFGGTASVSYLLKTMGKGVTFNDYLTSNSITAKAIIQNNSVRLYSEDFNPLFERNNHPGIVTEVLFFQGFFLLTKKIYKLTT
jgi:adenine-specific DNA methylase